MKTVMLMQNGHVKLTGNRFGGDTSVSESRLRRDCNRDRQAHKARKAQLRAEDSMLDLIEGGYDKVAEQPTAVTFALRRMGADRPMFNLDDVVTGARISKKKTRGLVVAIKLDAEETRDDERFGDVYGRDFVRGRGRGRNHRRPPTLHLHAGPNGQILAACMS